MTETLCSSGAVVLKAGVNAKNLTTAQYTQLINQSESFISAISRYDWVANFAGLSTNLKLILEDTCSARAAVFVLNNDTSALTSAEAQFRINVLWASVTAGLKELDNTAVQKYMGVTR